MHLMLWEKVETASKATTHSPYYHTSTWVLAMVYTMWYTLRWYVVLDLSGNF